jgi:hypothetical protein
MQPVPLLQHPCAGSEPSVARHRSDRDGVTEVSMA